MTHELAGQVAIVTGAGEGIGYQITADLVRAGAKVLLNDVDATKAQQAATAIGCVGVDGDMGDVAVCGIVERSG